MNLIISKLLQASLPLVGGMLMGSSCGRIPEPFDQGRTAHETAHLLARKHYSPEHFYASITEVRLLDTALCRDYLPEYRVYVVTGMDAWANPLFVNRPLVIGPNADPELLFDSEMVAKFLSRLNAPVDTPIEARRRLELFAGLQSYLTEEVHVLQTHREGEDDETRLSWRFRCVFITDVSILRREEHVITILSSGELVLEETTFLGQRTGYM